MEGKAISIGTEALDPETNQRRTYTLSWKEAKLTLTPDWVVVEGVPYAREVNTEINCFPREHVADINIEPYSVGIAQWYGREELK